jgi:hypothetical protein
VRTRGATNARTHVRTRFHSLAVKWSQVQILSARRERCQIRGGFGGIRSRLFYANDPPYANPYANQRRTLQLMGKRANGEGNVYQRANGTWEARLTHVDPDTGQRKRRSFYGPTAASVRAKLKEARTRVNDGAPVVDAKQTVASWLAHWRATTLAAPSRAESTKAQYAG